MRFAILLCTYNGEQFIREQLESLISQTYVDWTCYIFDDRSIDGTNAILMEFASRYPDKFIVTVNEAQSGAASKNFIASTRYVFEHYSFDLLSFCDQDDVWLPHKLATLASTFQRHSKNEPLAVFSDLSIVNARLEKIKLSFVEHISIGRNVEKHLRSGYLSVDNIAPGCALACNNALLRKSMPMSKYLIMHDWWLVLVAQKTGRLIFVPEPLVLYRQHDSNSVGAKKIGLISKILRIPGVARKLRQIIRMHDDLRSDESVFCLTGKYAYVKLYKFFRYQ